MAKLVSRETADNAGRDWCLLQARVNTSAVKGAAAKSVSTSKGNPPTRDTGFLPTVAAGGLAAVGGRIAFCRLAVAIPSNDGSPPVASTSNFVDFEMMPARKSHVPGQGQEVPGSGAGMELIIKPSLTELKVPGARPIAQAMGIAGEYIEFVGAFIGFDEYHSDNGQVSWDNPAYAQSQLNAWEKSQMLTNLVRAQKEVVLQMEWGTKESHGIRFTDASETTGTAKSTSVNFYGQIKNFKRAYATAQRVYYWIQICVLNRDDLIDSPDSSQSAVYGTPVQLNAPNGPTIPGGTGSTDSSNTPDANASPAAAASTAVKVQAQPQAPASGTPDVKPSSTASTPLTVDPYTPMATPQTSASGTTAPPTTATLKAAIKSITYGDLNKDAGSVKASVTIVNGIVRINGYKYNEYPQIP